MKQLLVLVGVQGSGKTTALNKMTLGEVLKPSTSRAKRFPAEDEYHFENAWDVTKMAWSIKRGTTDYGMSNAELNRIVSVGLTVFDPANLDVLARSSVQTAFEVITVGLDTIATVAEQNARVQNDVNRSMTGADFDTQQAVVRSCDVVLKGDAQTVAAALHELIAILSGRGGVLTEDTISRLIAAGTLLTDTVATNIEPASYDLRLADTYWCQGDYHTLDAQKPVATIPPYSFVFVQALETAVLPSFIVASFDIRVSTFFQGVVLSNGPQVDPGYRGGLFCMLYNASDTAIGINRQDHFATVQFQTTATNSAGYKAHHQNKKGFTDFIDGTAAKRPGGQILERVQVVADSVDKKFSDLRNAHWAIMAVFIAVALWLSDKAVDKIGDSVVKAQAENDEKVSAAIVRVDAAIERLNAATANSHAKRTLAVAPSSSAASR